MKFLHTSDLHLGKTLNNYSFAEDQKEILGQIVAIAERDKVDAVLIAGDIYQSAAASAEAMLMFNEFITRLTRNGHKVIMISGNHDSEARVAYFSALIEKAGVYTADVFRGRVQQVCLSDAYGEVVFHLLPYIHYPAVKNYIDGDKVTDDQGAVAAILRGNAVDTGKRNVILCHQFVNGAEQSESEVEPVGGLNAVDAHLFDAFDYVAMGHIHKPQKLLRDTMQYAGSPLKYSFSETDRDKSVVIVEMGAKGDIDVRREALKPVRDMRRIEGMLSEILDMPYSEDYVWVTIHDENPEPDARDRIRDNVFPNMMRMTVVNSKTIEDVEIKEGESVAKKKPDELFIEFYKWRNNGAAPTEEHMRVFMDILNELGVEEHEAD